MASVIKFKFKNVPQQEISTTIQGIGCKMVVKYNKVNGFFTFELKDSAGGLTLIPLVKLVCLSAINNKSRYLSGINGLFILANDAGELVDPTYDTLNDYTLYFYEDING